MIANKNPRPSVFIFEGRRTVTEQALTNQAALIACSHEDVLEAAVREHARLVFRIAYSVLRNHHDAEDATQETFMRALRYRRKLEGVRDPKTWLARIAWRVAVQRGTRRKESSVDEDAVLQMRSQLTSAEEFTLEREMSGLLESLIAALPENLREPLRLSTIEELGPSEVAEVLEVSEASVRSRVFRARQILKDKLAALDGKHGTAR
ncbi:MAG: RNA polymerase subunit sigma-24 [Acidobacteria bacterium]|nr:MAG: RNA polymerase subunit sigma-24 [Acidobacteriota bacterium]